MYKDFGLSIEIRNKSWNLYVIEWWELEGFEMGYVITISNQITISNAKAKSLIKNDK